MLAFRSEAHVERWLEQRELERGAAFSAEQMWRLAHAWYANRLAPDWRRTTPDEAQAVFAEIGQELYISDTTVKTHHAHPPEAGAERSGAGRSARP